ncbi:MAG: disulfide bond formation protein B [Pseudomonadota bacterium]
MTNRPFPAHSLRLFILLLASMCIVILTALAFEHFGGYQPCKLCLQQRQPWYLGIPIMMIATIGLFLHWPQWLVRSLIVIVTIILIYSVFLAVRHSGVEWGWWEGPSDCGAVDTEIATDTDDFLKQLEATVPPSCNDAALRVLGLSFAGWNAIVSLLLGFLAARIAFN